MTYCLEKLGPGAVEMQFLFCNVISGFMIETWENAFVYISGGNLQHEVKSTFGFV